MDEIKFILWANLGSILANKTRAGINIVPPPIPIPPIIPAGIKDFIGELKNIENPIVAKDEKKKLSNKLNKLIQLTSKSNS